MVDTKAASLRRLMVCDNEHQKILFKETLGGNKNCPLCTALSTTTKDYTGKEREAVGIFWDNL